MTGGKHPDCTRYSTTPGNNRKEVVAMAKKTAKKEKTSKKK